ncbi:hypothetical protein B597_002075 [Stutzerimonas stutzeri KOS6]|uniref:Uncharacterized protein n=1 Tax=Stutzerimonas stutzeri KOS6 TaxID=1218352 RepID=A0A061JW80_STUST|nr:hypothetical protein B597_002075 [Stutzerimonas stutzeri KOS6]
MGGSLMNEALILAPHRGRRPCEVPTDAVGLDALLPAPRLPVYRPLVLGKVDEQWSQENHGQASLDEYLLAERHCARARGIRCTGLDPCHLPE